MMYQALVEIRAAGIPALAGVRGYSYQAPHRGSPFQCDSDWDYLGWEEIDWVLLDRRGRPASWLDRKLTKTDREEINRELLELAAAARRQWAEEGDL